MNGSFFIGGKLNFTYDEKQVIPNVEPVLEGMGFSLVELKMKTIKGRTQVHLVVYRREGVTIENCSEIHKTILPRLEVFLEDQDIHLEVSSPGIGRVLKDEREYRIFTDVPISVLFEGESEWENGTIKNVCDASLDFDNGNELRSIDKDRIKKVKLV